MSTARTVESVSDEGVVDNLVTQFSNALDCFRELVQNSIDAGASSIEVWTEFEPGEGHLGTIAFHVDDFGEGMDEAIIDTKLTKLFASDKEDDLTKIGKFGIGFVSVFALKPAAVLLHTGRAGEYWEVLFHADRSFDKTRLDYPVEGTQITIFLKGDIPEYREYVEGIRRNLKRWCCHADTEILFEDRSPISGQERGLEVINEEFLVDGLCAFNHEFEDGTQFALAYADSPEYGFYNRGLTLAFTDIAEQVFSEIRSHRMNGVSMKVKSRYLEHTLSRDTIVRDANYYKAMEMLDEAREELFERLIRSLEQLATKDGAWTFGDMEHYSRCVAFLGVEPQDAIRSIVSRPIFRGVHGGGYSARLLFHGYRADGHILVADEPTGLTRRLAELGIPVVHGRRALAVEKIGHERVLRHPLDGVGVALSELVDFASRESLFGKVRHFFKGSIKRRVQGALRDPTEVYLPVKVLDSISDEHRAIVDDASRLLDEIDAKYKKIKTFEPTNDAGAPFFVTGRSFDTYMARPGPGRASELDAAVNVDSEEFRRMVGLYKTEPAFAAYCLAKCLLLHNDHYLDRDAALMKAARS